MSVEQKQCHWQPYQSYKPSGIEWLGHIPEHWDARRLKHLAAVQFSSVDKHIVEGEKSVRLCNYVDVYYNDFINESLEFMLATATRNEITRFQLRQGDVLVTKDSEAWDDIAVPAYVAENIDGVLCGYHLAHIRPDLRKLIGEYLFRAFRSSGINDQFRVAANGITRFGLGKYWLDNGLFPVPPLPEQHAIAAFLDRETARIDTLIEKKQRQIELLQEKRSALISHAVTRGLNPDVTMKDSGIEWLGEVPEHWDVRRLKHLAAVQFSSVDKHTIEGEEPISLCNYVDVYYNEFINEGLEFMSATATMNEITRFQLCRGDVLVTKDSEAWDDIAVPAYVVEELDGVLCGYHLAHIRPNPRKLIGKYLFRMFRSSGINHQFRVAANGITRFGLGKYWLDNGLFLVPPLQEQQRIITFLDRETKKIDVMREKIKSSIEKLREYRTALISAAVTGKIDVRDSNNN